MEKTYQDYFEQQYLSGENIIAFNKLEGKYLSLNDDKTRLSPTENRIQNDLSVDNKISGNSLSLNDNNIRLSQNDSHIQNDLSVENKLSALSLSLNNKVKLSETDSYIKSSLTVGDNITTDPNAIVEVKSNTKALLLPILTITNRDNLDNIEGLIIYNSDNKDIEYNNGTIWRGLKPFKPEVVEYIRVKDAVLNNDFTHPTSQTLINNFSSNRTGFLSRNYTALEEILECNQGSDGSSYSVVFTTTNTQPIGVYHVKLRLGKDNTSPIIQVEEQNSSTILINNFNLYNPAGDGDQNLFKEELEFYITNSQEQKLAIGITAVGSNTTNPSFGFLIILDRGVITRIQ